MRPNNDNSPLVYMGIDGVYTDGVRIGTMGPIREISLVQNEDGSLGFEPSFSVGVDLANESDFTASFKLPHMSRKSFVSKLMKLGYSKKEAKKIAWGVHKEKHCYASTYAIYAIGRCGLT